MKSCETNAVMKDLRPLQGLRGVCAMAIVLGHQSDIFLSPPETILPGPKVTWMGVEYFQAVTLFFLLSGIPLARLYTHRRPSGRDSDNNASSLKTWSGARRFWIKRLARIAPIYYLALVLNLVAFGVTINASPHSLCSSLWPSLLTCALFMQGWLIGLVFGRVLDQGYYALPI